ncbi:MAG TPA: pepsin/retropepsin-like aspartic protease family protein, partial [Bacteroidales bacterium]|nr:pepsin/retropepsin-like aspartic protease family protein [Bacteroidales bacterium]
MMKKKSRFTILMLAILTGLLSPSFARADQGPEPAMFCISKTLLIPGMILGTGPEGAVPTVVTVPLKRVGHLFMIEAVIDNETGNFLFDTGSQQLVLNSIYFRKYMTTEESPGGGVTGSVASGKQAMVKRLDISGILNENIMADVTDLGHLETRRGVKIFGLFGFAMLKNLEIVIDAGHNQLILYRLDHNGQRIGSPEKEFRCDLIQKAELFHNILFLQASVGGKILNFCFDTGAESNVLSSWLPRRVMDQVTIERRSDLSGVGTARLDVLYGKLNDFMLGSHQIPGMQVIIASLENMAASFGHSLDGMLGFDFLEQGVISVNLVTKDVKIAFGKGGKP